MLSQRLVRGFRAKTAFVFWMAILRLHQVKMRSIRRMKTMQKKDLSILQVVILI